MPEDSTIDTIALELLAGVPPQDPQQEQASEEVQDPIQEQGEPQVQQAVMTEDFVKMNGLPNFFVGKPFEELAKSYSHANRKLSQLPPKNETKVAPQEPLPQDDEIPDPVEDFEGFKKWYKESNKRMQEEAVQIALSRVNPELEVVSRMKQQEQIAYIEKELSKEFSAEEIQAISKEYLESTPGIESKIPLYQANPDMLIYDLTLYGKAKKLPELAKRNGQEAVNKIAQTINKVQPVKTPSIVKPQSQKNSSVIDEIADDLMGL